MAAARHIPRAQVTQNINIDSTFTPSPQAVKIAPGTEVNFNNNSGTTINITFAPNPPGPALFSNTPNLGPGTIDGQMPQAANGSVNYYVNVVGGASYGPFAIQVGNGPLYIQATYTNNAGYCTPDPAVIPVAGALQMVNTDNHSYNVGWGGVANPFSPALTTVGGQSGNIVHQSIAPAGTYTYSVTKVGPMLGSGGGKIIIKSA